MVSQCDRLRSLQMCIARHYRIGVLFCKFCKSIEKLTENVVSFCDFFF